MAEVELRVSADLDQATREVAGFRKEYADLVRQVEKPLRQVNATRELEASLEATGKRVQQAKQRLSELQAELIRTDSPTERLKQSFKEAAAELQKLQRTEAMQTNQLSRMRAELAGAGVDTSRLAAEQRRLNTEMSKALGTGRADAAARGIRERAAALQQQAIAQRQANAEAARDNLGVNRYRALQAEITKARQQYDLLRTSGKLSTQELAVAQQQLTQRIRESNNELEALSGAQGGIGGLEGLTTGRVAGAVGGIAGAAALAAQYVAAVDPVKNMRAQLELATASQQEFNQAAADTARIADLARTPITDTATLYARLLTPLREVGRSQQDASNVTEAFALGLKISGSSAQTAAGSIQQYAQAVGSGVFQAQEYNSVVDGNIRLIQAFSQELGVSVAEFKKLVLAGEITTDVLADLSNKVLPQLRAEVESMPETWEGATTRLKNSWQQLIGRFDETTGASQLLIEKINTLSASLDLLRSGSADSAAAGVANISAEFGRLVPLLNLAAIGAEKLGEIAGIKTFAQSAKDAVKQEGEVLQERKTQFDMHAAEMKALQQSAAKEGAAMLEQQVKDTEAALKKQVDAERKAASDLAKAKQAQLETQQRYKEALASLSAGPAQEASYGQASALKVGARNALQAGDVDEAKRQAQAALAVLQELAAAGENTYGFAGFIKELQAIEEGADQKGIDEAQKKLDAAKAAALQTKAALEELKDIKVAPTLDEEAQQKLLNDLAALAKQAGVILTIPATVTAQASQGGTVDPSIPAAATGGILRGPGTGTSDSILARLSNGEGVLNARAVQHYGAGMVHQLNRLQLPKFATGGVVGTGLSLPPIPQPSPELLAGGGNAYLGDTTLLFPGGESLTVSVPASQAENLQLLRLKFGGTRRR